MRKTDYLLEKLQTIEIKKRTIAQLLEAMEGTGFQGKTLAKSFEIIKKMIMQKENIIFLGYAGSMSTTGQWKIIKWLIKQRFIDVLVSTGANISEDIFEALGYSYFQGNHVVEDTDLLKNQIDRYYDVYADELDYRKMEEFIHNFMLTLDTHQTYSSAEFLHQFGKYQTEQGIDSITAAAYQAGVPIFSPGMADSGYGIAAYLLHRKHNLHITVDQLKDFEQLGQIGEQSKNTSVIYIGGGVPKDTIQLVTIMKDLAKGGKQIYPHKYAVQITTDSPQWGGLSGCTFEEAVSWGKIDNKTDHVICYCDATIALPILSHALLETINKKRVGINFCKLLDME